VKALPLAPCQPVNVQPRQGGGTAGSSCLQGFEFVQSFVEPPGEMGLVSGYLSGSFHQVHTKRAIVQMCGGDTVPLPPLYDQPVRRDVPADVIGTKQVQSGHGKTWSR
jgi:hypothetical protein